MAESMFCPKRPPITLRLKTTKDLDWLLNFHVTHLFLVMTDEVKAMTGSELGNLQGNFLRKEAVWFNCGYHKEVGKPLPTWLRQLRLGPEERINGKQIYEFPDLIQLETLEICMDLQRMIYRKRSIPIEVVKAPGDSRDDPDFQQLSHWSQLMRVTDDAVSEMIRSVDNTIKDDN